MKRRLLAAIVASGVALATTGAFAETWSVRETGAWHGRWILSSEGRGAWSGHGYVRSGGGEVRYDIEVIERGDTVAAHRTNSSDGNDCMFYWTRNSDSVSGDYFCRNGGPYHWSAVME
ncbi:MAG: hypothetical protein GC190_10130 [Alphaproteobacteria bacterium]|nr:hypothetical protein [Alphaproteobacteria bacterium]